MIIQLCILIFYVFFLITDLHNEQLHYSGVLNPATNPNNTVRTLSFLYLFIQI